MKEKRKEREEMKKRKEEEQRKKAEDQARKQEPRAKEKAKKEARRTKKAKGKQSATVGAKRGPNTQSIRPSKFPRMESSSSEQVNDNECCVCLVLYGDDQSGKDWVACVCGRWLHEDCADDCVIDSDRNRRLCFICLNNL